MFPIQNTSKKKNKAIIPTAGIQLYAKIILKEVKLTDDTNFFH